MVLLAAYCLTLASPLQLYVHTDSIAIAESHHDHSLQLLGVQYIAGIDCHHIINVVNTVWSLTLRKPGMLSRSRSTVQL